jgi:hypothetical protein
MGVPLRLRPPNPIKSEADAFGFLVWFVVLVAILVAVILIARSV